MDASDAMLRDPDPATWPTYGGTYDEQRHSSLDQINSGNVGQLGVAWSYEMKTDRGVEATPIVADGVMYVTSAWSVVHALDAATGKELWTYDPQVDRARGVDGCCDVVNRGVALYGGKVFVGVFDGRLEALDAKSGKRLWSTVTVDQTKPYTITGAPRVADGLVFIGNGGAELGVRGYLSAYDADSGKLVWRFYTTPNPDKKPDGAASDEALKSKANATWGDKGEWRSAGGGGTVWDSIVYDQVNDQIIFGVGNGSPWNAEVRDPEGKGDNLFLSSIVAVDARTGRYKWHFQTTPRDQWDYTSTQPIMLADLPLGVDGKPRRVVMQSPKNGFFYILDAATGAYLSAKPISRVTWATGVDAQGRAQVSSAARYSSRASATILPGPFGIHNWHPMAYDPKQGLVYIPAQEIPLEYVEDKLFGRKPTKWNNAVDMGHGVPLDPPIGIQKAIRATLNGRLIAWDPIKQQARWSVPYDRPFNGGVLSTAGGVVFQGTAGGEFIAYDAADGKKLWSAPVYAGAVAGPVTYRIGKDQYVAITTGWGSGFALFAGYAFPQKVGRIPGRVVVFKLGGTAKLEKPAIASVDATPKAKPFGDKAMLEQGLVDYHRNCQYCHGVMAVSSGILPDLRWSPASGDPEVWNQVVLGGALAANGMVSFKHELSREDAEAIRAYVVHQANHRLDD
ncbi:MAG: PQQ-dependent dehydrogenase, methanol/ethanol family [Sphingobium sp.]